MTIERMLAQLDTLSVDDVRRVVARGQELLALAASGPAAAAEAAPALRLDGLGAAGGAQAGVSYRQEYVRCGKARCKRCGPDGEGHGPYWYAYWSAGGRTRSKYLGKTLPKTPEPAVHDQPPTVATSAEVVAVPAPTIAPLCDDQAAPAHASLTVWLRPGGRKRHLSINGRATLCAVSLAGAEPLRAGIFAHDDCQRCRRAAAVLGRACDGCGLPLLREAEGGRCYACVSGTRVSERR